MNDLNLINTAVAAATSIGFLASLAVTLILALACRGLYLKARRLQRELDAAKESKRVLMGTLHQSYLEKARLTVEKARLAGRIRDLLLQRRALGFALFYADDAITLLGSELRSANRQLAAAHCRNGRLAAERDEARVALGSAERRLRWARQDYALGRAVFSPAGRPVSLNIDVRLDINPAQLFVTPAKPIQAAPRNFVMVTPGAAVPEPASIVESRPAPSRLVGTVRPGRVKFTWQRNAVDNTDVEFSLNGGPWKSLGSGGVQEAEFIMPANVTTLFRVRNVWRHGAPYSTPSNHVALTTAAPAA